MGDGGIPYIDDLAEAEYDYSEIQGWEMISAFWTKFASIALKQYYKYENDGQLSFGFNEVSILAALTWNFLIGLWSDGIDFALGITYLQLPWNIMLWFVFDGEFGMEMLA